MGKSAQQMKIADPSSNRMEKDYEQSDLERLLGKREWHSYDEMIKWLQEQGDEDRRFTPGEVRHMIEDLSRVQQQGKEFTTDANKLYAQMRSR
jgi:hypothetical protein